MHELYLFHDEVDIFNYFTVFTIWWKTNRMIYYLECSIKSVEQKPIIVCSIDNLTSLHMCAYATP